MSGVYVWMPFATIGLVLVGMYIGGVFRNRTHALVAFNEPLSYILLALTLTPYMLDVFEIGKTPDIFYDPNILAVYAGFWVGYLIGYLRNPQDIIYVAVHQIVDRTQDIEPIVRYTNRDGRMCWQPQGFKEICKTVFFGIHNPLQLSGNIYRTRHVSMRSVFLKLEADTVDLAGLEINDYEETRWKFRFHVQSRRYIPSPNCSDSPYDWFVRAEQYEEVFVKYADLQTNNAELQASLQTAQIEGGAMVLNALAGKNPSSIFMDQLKVDMEEIVGRRQRSKQMKRTSKEAQQTSPEADADV